MRVIVSLAAGLVLTSCQTTSAQTIGGANVEARIQAAQKASAQNDLQGCIMKFTEALTLSPAFVTAYVGRAECYVRVGNPYAAVEDYSQAIRLSSQDPQLYLGRAAAESSVGNVTAASADYNKLAELSTANQDELVNAAEGLRGFGSYLGALTIVDGGLGRYGNSWDLHRERAIVESNVGNDSEALREFAIASRLAAGANLAQVRADRGDFYLLRQEYNLAIGDYAEAIRLDSTRYYFAQQRARARAAIGELAGAESDYSIAIGLYQLGSFRNPDVIAELFIERGRVIQQQGFPQRALADFRKALQASRASNTSQRIVIANLITAVGG